MTPLYYLETTQCNTYLTALKLLDILGPSTEISPISYKDNLKNTGIGQQGN